MNLADANLKHVNTSRPQLIHSTSKQSITASDDYYSLTSQASSNEEHSNGQRYETPPLHMRQQQPAQNVIQSEATIPPIQPIKHRQGSSDTSEEKPAIPPRNDEHKIKRKPVSTSSQSTIKDRPQSGDSAPTPGVDDTPYVRYAIDSLTRDEGSYYGGTVFDDHEPRSSSHYPPRNIRNVSQSYHEPSAPSSRESRSSLVSQVLLPTEPIGSEAFKYPKLVFVPRPLRAISISVLIFLCLLMMAGLVFCAIWPSSHQGLYNYDGSGTRRYFIFQYLPQILALIILMWLFVIQSAIHRILPFITLSSGSDEQTSTVIHNSALFSTAYLIPDLTYFKYREPALGLCSIAFWLALFTVPLQSSLFQTRYYVPDETWIWTTVVPVAWTLFALYVLLAGALTLLLLRFVLYESGLKWDPVSLADLLVIFRQSNILNEFETSEIDPSILRRQRPKSLRLGYWKTSRRDAETFYCIGDENMPIHRFSLERGKMQPIQGQSSWPPISDPQPQKSMTVNTLQSDIHDPHLRYRWTPWFLRDTFIVLWIVTAVVLLLAFLVVSFVNSAVEKGFLPLLPAPTTTEGFSPANFLYSFLPSLIGMLLFLLWQPIDQYFRALQPFANLSSAPQGVSAARSLLLDYNACLPFETTIKALSAGSYKLAWISFTSLYSATLPVLAGGIFTAQFNVPTQSVRMAASMPGYEALVVFTVLYALSFLLIWPTRKRRLPHDISTLSQLVSYFYQSPLLTDPAFREPRSKIDLVTRLITTPLGETQLPKYHFGVYNGLDGREHLGIDRIDRPIISHGQGEKQIPQVSGALSHPQARRV